MRTVVPKFLWTWPSWVVEAMSGVVTVAAVLGMAWLAGRWWGLIVVATVVSLIYEQYVDANGFAWEDVGQRQVAILLAVALWVLVR